MKTNLTFAQARMSLLLDHVFFGSLVMHLEERADPSAEKGLWVDGKSIGYSPEAFEQLDIREGAGLIAKGVLQCAFGHHLRRGDRDAKLWQRACDLVTNQHILDSGLRLPAGAETDRQYIEQNLAAEQVYSILEAEALEQQEQQGNDGKPQDGQQGSNGDQQGDSQPGSGKPQQGGRGKPQSSTGEIRDLPGDSEGESEQDGNGNAPSQAEINKQAQEWDITLKQAVLGAQQRGDCPAGLIRAAEQALAPEVSWKDETRKFAMATAKNDTTWNRPNRRFISQGLYLPAIHSERVKKFVLAIDTSGSISARILGAFEACMNDIFEDLKPEGVTVVYCDAAVNAVEEFEDGATDLKIKAVGGGGTSFGPVFDFVEQQGIEPAGLIYLTDLDGSFPDEKPGYPVLWASFGRTQAAPFGEVVKLDISQR